MQFSQQSGYQRRLPRPHSPDHCHQTTRFNVQRDAEQYNHWLKTAGQNTHTHANTQPVTEVTLEHKSLGYICSNSQQYTVWVKIIHFSFMTKIIRILRSCSMKIFCTFLVINISKHHFCLVICIAKNLI